MKQLSTLLFVTLTCVALSESRHSIVNTIVAERHKAAGPNDYFNLLSNGIQSVHISLSPDAYGRQTATLPDGRLYPSSAALALVQGTHSGLPMGSISFIERPFRSDEPVSTRNTVIWTPYEDCGVRVSGIPPALQTPQTAQWVEKLARLSLAKYAADKRIRAGGSQAVNGRSVAGFTAQKSNVNYVRFADWASARGVQYTYDSVKCTISFTRNGKSVLLPIAAQAVRINGTWRDLPDIVMISPDREERTLVPIALDALTN